MKRCMPKKPTPHPKEGRHKKPGPDSPYEIAQETRTLVREIHAATVGHSKDLTPQQIKDLAQISKDIQRVIDSLNAADQP